MEDKRQSPFTRVAEVASAVDRDAAVAVAGDLAVVMYGPLLQNLITVWGAVQREELGEGLSQWGTILKALYEWGKAGGKGKLLVDMKGLEELTKTTVLRGVRVLACLRSHTYQSLSIGLGVRDHVENLGEYLLERMPEKVSGHAVPEAVQLGCRLLLTVFLVYISSLLQGALMTSSAILASSRSIATRLPLPLPYTTPFAYALAAVGHWHVFIHGGHRSLPTPLRYLLYIPLKLDSFIGIIAGVTPTEPSDSGEHDITPTIASGVSGIDMLQGVSALSAFSSYLK